MPTETTPKRGIVLYPEEVVAIIEGRQTAIVRPIEPQPREVVPDGGLEIVKKWVWDGDGSELRPGHPLEWLLHNKGPVTPGEPMWVMEEWAFGMDVQGFDAVVYKADNTKLLCDRHLRKLSTLPALLHSRQDWRPADTMPQWASRLTIVPTDARAVQVGDITIREAIAAGVPMPNAVSCDGDALVSDTMRCPPEIHYGFIEQWNSRHPSHPYSGQPWAWFAGIEAKE